MYLYILPLSATADLLLCSLTAEAQQFILRLKFLITVAWGSLQGANRRPAVIFTSEEVHSAFFGQFC